jgi:hypothetical protein
MTYKNKIQLLLFISIAIGILARFYYFSDIDGWFDEWNMIYTVDPTISNNLTWKRYFGYRGYEPGEVGYYHLPEYYPPLNAFILKYFSKIFGYYNENLRLFSITFGCSSIVLVYKVTRLFAAKKYATFATFFFSSNLFLIWQSSEIRPHSFVVFFSLLVIYLFIKILNKDFHKSKLLFISYIFTSIILLSSWPFTLIIFFSKFIFLIQRYLFTNKIKYSLFLTLIIICVFYIVLNIDYLLYHLAREEHYTKLYLAFFYSYHFRSFFGSIYLGAILLIIFSIMVVYRFREIFFNWRKDNLIIITIISSYFLTIIYSLLGASVISPKYIIFALPLIIIWISINLERLNFKYKNFYLTVLISIYIVNSAINFKNSPIDRPPSKRILSLISNSNTSSIYTPESIVFNNFIRTHKQFHNNNLKIEKIQNISNTDKKFWYLCLNNPRFAVGDNNFPDEKKCVNFNGIVNGDFKKIKEIKLPDYLLVLYEKK